MSLRASSWRRTVFPKRLKDDVTATATAKPKQNKLLLLLLLLLLLTLGLGAVGAIAIVAYTRTLPEQARQEAEVQTLAIRNRQILVYSNTLLPRVGDQDIVTIVVENSSTNTTYVGLEVTTVIESTYVSSIVVTCAPLFTSNVIASLAPGQKVACRGVYYLTVDDVEQLTIISANSSLNTGQSYVSLISLETGDIVLESAAAEFGFAHGNCSGSGQEPPLPCSSTQHLDWSYLCQDTNQIWGCNTSGWASYFDLSATGGGSGGNAYTTTSSSFTQPDCDALVLVQVVSSAWMVPGQVVFVESGGYYMVSSIVDATEVMLINLCATGNANPGATIPSSGGVSPGGVSGSGGGATTTAPVTFNGTADIVVVGSALAYSEDGGNSFTAITIPDFGVGNDVTYSLAHNLWVAVGTGSIPAIYSTDGGNWDTSALVAILDIVGYAVCWSDEQGLFVAGGQGSTYNIATSSNGIDWVGRASPITGSVRGIAYSPQRNVWVASGTGGALIAYSLDGLTWTTGATFISTLTASHVSWGAEAGMFLVSITGGAAVTTTARSYDGVNWMFYAGAYQPQAVATGSVWNTTQFYITGSSSTDTLMTTSDGVTFAGQGKDALSVISYGACVAADFGRLFVVGVGTNGSITFISSGDGGGSTTQIDLPVMSVARRCFARYTVVPNVTSPAVPAYAADFVSMGQGTSATLMYSLDGGTYFNPLRSTLFSTVGYSVAYSLPLARWVAVGQGGNSGAYSNDGVTWNASSSLNSIFTTYGYDVAWSDNQTLWVAGGNGASFKIATSTDGITWTGRSSPFTTAVFGVAYSPERDIWVAAGSGSCAIASSPDGITWTLQMGTYSSIVGRRVTWASELGLFLAMLNGGPANAVSTATSVNGIAWSPLPGAFSTTSVGYGVAWNGTRFMLTGQGTNSSFVLNTLESSANGVDIVEHGSTVFTVIGNDVCWGADYGRWVFGGQGTNTLHSIDVSTGVTVSYSPYSTAGFKCAAKYTTEPVFVRSAGPTVLADFVAAGSGVNGLAYSLSGGRYWTPTGGKQFTTGLGVAYSEEQTKWVAVGSGGLVAASSTDGITWTALPNLVTALAVGFSSAEVHWSKNQSLWLVASTGTRIVTSPDTVTWTTRTPPFTTVTSLTYAPELGLYAATGIQGGGAGTVCLATSPDLITWTNRVTKISGSDAVGTIRWSPQLGQFLAGYVSASSRNALRSTDGITWTSVTTLFPAGSGNQGVRGNAWNGTTWLVVGEGGGNAIGLSPDGAAFTAVGSTFGTTQGWITCWGNTNRRWVIGSLAGTNRFGSMDADTGTTISNVLFTSTALQCSARETNPYS